MDKISHCFIISSLGVLGGGQLALEYKVLHARIIVTLFSGVQYKKTMWYENTIPAETIVAEGFFRQCLDDK